VQHAAVLAKDVAVCDASFVQHEDSGEAPWLIGDAVPCLCAEEVVKGPARVGEAVEAFCREVVAYLQDDIDWELGEPRP
jgi:hypothetical protein